MVWCATAVTDKFEKWSVTAPVILHIPIVVGIPPLAEQHRIVAKFDALMALCDRLEATLTTADTTRTRLLEAILHEALKSNSTALEASNRHD